MAWKAQILYILLLNLKAMEQQLCAAVCLDLAPYPGPGKLRSYAILRPYPEQGNGNLTFYYRIPTPGERGPIHFYGRILNRGSEKLHLTTLSHGLEAQILSILLLHLRAMEQQAASRLIFSNCAWQFAWI